MNGDEELPSDHFWDSEEAEQEYDAIGQAIAEAEEKLSEAQSRLLTVQAVYDSFSGTPGVAAVVRRFSWEEEESVLNLLNEALNPYWLPPEGKFKSYDQSLAPWQGSMVVQKVESETVRDKVYYGRHKKRDRAYVQCWREYSCEKRVEWYTPTGDVGMSGLERSLRYAASPFVTPNSLYDKSLEEVKQEVYAFICPLSREVVLKFIPDLAPTNIEEIRYSSGIYKEDVPKREWPLLARYEAPKAGERYGLASYKGICWVCCGRWELHQFPKATLKNVWERIERIEDRLREQIADAAKEVVRCEEEIMLLCRRKEKIRILHYKPMIYREFRSLLDAPVSIPDRNGGDVSRVTNRHE